MVSHAIPYPYCNASSADTHCDVNGDTPTDRNAGTAYRNASCYWS